MTLLVPDQQSKVSSCAQIFLLIYNPRLLFVFEEFVRLFASEVIPAQVAIRRPLVLFNPAKLLTFGMK
jgi:hypothetical protein